ncbi:MAG: oxidoreductase [Alphaproteobacteria bacterium RIFCSPHIGHO2_12_FULL_63_12]|nr:MAG: oxidoreductase [Alphaproteobacteria bacterium RIFCSPHIGHO2_12_FULL_63_12]
MKVAFLGLGVMGFPMAGHLAARGFEVAVYNRTAEKAARWTARHKGRAAADPASAAAGAEIVFSCLGDDPDVEAVMAAAAPAIGTGAVVVDHTTASPRLARQLAERFAAAGVGFVDAPVSGGQAGAESGKLAVMCGGEAADVDRARPAIEAYAARIVHIGPAGHGQLCKAVNQICIAGVLQGLAEGVHFARTAGLDLDRVHEAISGGAAQSWQMNNRMKTMAEDKFDFGFAVDWMRKDLRIALDDARTGGAQLPLTALVDQFYADIQAMGGGRLDTSSLIKRLK